MDPWGAEALHGGGRTGSTAETTRRAGTAWTASGGDEVGRSEGWCSGMQTRCSVELTGVLAVPSRAVGGTDRQRRTWIDAAVRGPLVMGGAVSDP